MKLCFSVFQFSWVRWVCYVSAMWCRYSDVIMNMSETIIIIIVHSVIRGMGWVRQKSIGYINPAIGTRLAMKWRGSITIRQTTEQQMMWYIILNSARQTEPTKTPRCLSNMKNGSHRSKTSTPYTSKHSRVCSPTRWYCQYQIIRSNSHSVVGSNRGSHSKHANKNVTGEGRSTMITFQGVTTWTLNLTHSLTNWHPSDNTLNYSVSVVYARFAPVPFRRLRSGKERMMMSKHHCVWCGIIGHT